MTTIAQLTRSVSAWILTLSMTAGCASTPALETPSGRPEVTISAPPAAIIDALVAALVANGWTLESQTPNSILATRVTTGVSSAFTQLALGNSYSTTPKIELRYVLSPIGNQTRVFAQSAVSTQMAFGQVRRVEHKNRKNDRALQDELERLKVNVERAQGTAWR